MLPKMLHINNMCACLSAIYFFVSLFHLIPTKSSVSSLSSLNSSDSMIFIDDNKSLQGTHCISHQCHPHYFPLYLISQFCFKEFYMTFFIGLPEVAEPT
jgi:hypothetical protein